MAIIDHTDAFICCTEFHLISEICVTATTVELLKEANVDVVLRKELAQRYAVIDGSIVWYGSVDLLAFGRKDADVLRFENADIAGDLLALNDESMCEQLIIQDAQYES